MKITERQFDDEYIPVPREDGEVVRDFEDLAELEKAGKLNCVWTLVDGDDGGMYALAGVHVVNRVGYIVTEKPWQNDDDEAVWIEPREEDDEPEDDGPKVPEPLTVAYIAKGAAQTLRDDDEKLYNPDDWEGELGFIGQAIEPALMLDRVAAKMDGHPGVWVYEVAETFGERYAMEMLAWHGAGGPEPDAEALLLTIMVEAEYPVAEVVAAIESLHN